MVKLQPIYYHLNTGKPSEVFQYEHCRCIDADPMRASNSTDGKRPCAYPECRPPEAKP